MLHHVGVSHVMNKCLKQGDCGTLRSWLASLLLRRLIVPCIHNVPCYIKLCGYISNSTISPTTLNSSPIVLNREVYTDIVQRAVKLYNVSIGCIHAASSGSIWEDGSGMY